MLCFRFRRLFRKTTLARRKRVAELLRHGVQKRSTWTLEVRDTGPLQAGKKLAYLGRRGRPWAPALMHLRNRRGAGFHKNIAGIGTASNNDRTRSRGDSKLRSSIPVGPFPGGGFMFQPPVEYHHVYRNSVFATPSGCLGEDIQAA